MVADSVNYIAKWKKPYARVQMGGIQTNSIFNKIVKANKRFFEVQSSNPSSDFHSEEYLPKKIDINLEDLDLQLDKRSNKYYFEIPSDTTEFPNLFQKVVLLQIFGKDGLYEKLQLLHKVNRKHIRCLFENPEYVVKNSRASNTISRLCVVWPFDETIVIDFAGTLEDYGDLCLLGTLIGAKEKQIEKKAKEIQTESVEWSDEPRIDDYV